MSRFEEADMTLSDVISDDENDVPSTPSSDGADREANHEAYPIAKNKSQVEQSEEENYAERATRSPTGDGVYNPVGRKSQFSATTCDLMRVTANRFTYSKQYITAYAILTVLSIATVAISFSEPKGCPPLPFYILELIVLIALLAEVGVRVVALRQFFWRSYWNIADAIMMVICAITLILVFAGCTKAVRLGRQSSTVLLVIRNIVQIVRLVNLLWRNRSNIENRRVDIDLGTVQESGFELLPDEEEHIPSSEPMWDVEREGRMRL